MKVGDKMKKNKKEVKGVTCEKENTGTDDISLVKGYKFFNHK